MIVVEELRARLVPAARAAYGHIKGRDDVDCLVLWISNMEHHAAQHLDVLNLNAAQAQRIAHLERLLK